MNRTPNCLTVSNLKLDDVFSYVFGKSEKSITEYIISHLGESFDVTPFVDRLCKKPIEEIQAAVDGAVSREKAAKSREYLNHIDKLKLHKQHIESEVLRLAEHSKVLSTAQALDFLRLRGYVIKDRDDFTLQF